MKTTAAFASGSVVGAALVFFTDPIAGRRRRALARDAAIHSRKVLARAITIAASDTAHRIQGIIETIKDAFEPELGDDAVLTDRVRTEIGRVCSHPNVEVLIEDGCVTLLGPVVAWERRPILKAARSVKGVCGVVDRMEPYFPLPTMPTQQMKGRRTDILRRHWAPATRIVVGAIGTYMAAEGVKSLTPGRVAALVAGLALLIRAATNKELKSVVGLDTRKAA